VGRRMDEQGECERRRTSMRFIKLLRGFRLDFSLVSLVSLVSLDQPAARRDLRETFAEETAYSSGPTHLLDAPCGAPACSAPPPF
jgi:hypothetical protein